MALLSPAALNALAIALKSKLVAAEVQALLNATSVLSAAEIAFIDGVVAGTVSASQAMVVDANKDISGVRHFTITGNLVTGSTTLSEAELGVLDAVVAGTQAASKAIVNNANSNQGIAKVTQLHIGASGSETQVTATGTELNVLAGAVAGTPAQSKAVIPSGSGLDIGTIGNTTIGTTKTLAVTDADKITSGGVIVATGTPLVDITVSLSATKTLYNIFVARDAWQITAIDYTPDVAQGGALTATVVKATGTATPASATTPMHTAGAINLNGTAHTVQSITPTVTTADLQLAAGDRIGLVLSGALTVGSGNIAVRGKRI